MKAKKLKAVIRGIAAALVAFFLLGTYSEVQAQLATYPLATGSANPTPGTINPAASNPNVNAGKMLYGGEMGNSHNSQGYRAEYEGSEDYWPSVPTNSCSFDFPFSPNPGFDLTITGITANINSPNNNPALKIQPYFQIDGAGPWIPLSNALDVTSATTSLNFPVNESFFNGHTYVIRFYVYGVGSADDNEDFRIRDIVFAGTTQAPAVKPTVATLTAVKSATKPKYEGVATGKYDFGPAFQLVKEVGVVWSTSANPDVSLATKTTNGAAGNINSTITGLAAGTLYHVRAYIVTQLGTYYGADLTFTTDPPSKPVVTTNPVPPASIFSNKAIAGGAIVDSGGLAITEKGLVWNNGGGATTTTNLGKWIAGSGTAPFSDFIKGLKPNTNYCVNAYAINSLGTSYGTDVCFKTGPPVPVLAAIPGTLDFGENFFGGAAITLSYTLEGSNLNPASGNISMQIPAGFSMSTSSNGPFTKGPGTITVPYTESSFSKPIYVQLPTTAYANNLTGTITHSGGGVAAGDADVVKVTGSIIQSPDDVSNKGTEFWTGFGYQETMRNQSGSGKECMMSIYISNSGTTPVTATIELPGIPGAANFPQTVTIQPGTVFEKTGFPTADPTDSRLYFTGVTNRGIHIISSAPVSVWMHTYADNNSAAATMLFPTNTWGSAYTVQSYGGQSNNANPNSFFFVIAKDDNTLIEFTPANDIIANIAALYFKDGNTPADVLYKKGQTYQITLNRGQVFNAMGYIQGSGKNSAVGLDLTGTPVKAICDALNPNGEEKKIAVFAGNSRVLVLTQGCNADEGSDHLIQQMFPTVAWGTDYLTAPTRTMEWNMFRIMPRSMAAKVSVNGVLLTAANIPAGASYYQIEGNQPLHITSDLPICVTQFIVAGNCAKSHGSQPSAGDPEMIILSPTQQAIKNVTVYSSNIKKNPGGCGNTSASYINVIIKKEGVASFTYDGSSSVDLGTPNTFKPGSLTPATIAFKPHPADPNYMYAQIFATCGKSHTIKSDYPFNAIAYGMGDGESYGYNAGTALKNLSSIKFADNPYGKDTSTTVVRTCKENPVTLRIALPYNTTLVDSVIWDPGSDPRISPLGAKKGAMNGAVAKSDGSITQDGRTFNIYTSPTQYKFSDIGAYKFTVIAYGKFDSDCGNRDVQKIIVVVGRDNIAFDYNPPSCGSTIITFADKTEPMAGTTLKSWAWDFGDGKKDNTQNPPAHTYSPNPPTYWVKLTTTNSIGCFSIDSALVDFSGGMKARFLAAADTVCPGSPVNFSNAENSTSDGSSGTIIEWNWDFGDTKTYQGTSPATANPPAHSYAKPGTYIVKLTVKSNLGCPSTPVDTTITVKDVPVPNFDLPGGICIPGSTLFKNTSTITDGTIGTVTYEWDFDDAANSTPANPNITTDNDGTHIYTVAPPASPGYYAVKLKATSEFGCFEDTIKQVKDVFSPPVADFKLPTGSEVCLNSDSSFVSTSTATGGQTFSNYAWDFGDGSAVQSGANLQTVKHLFDIEGSKDVKLVVTTNKGCIDSITQPINVATPPVADFTWSANTCVGNEVTFTDASGPVGVVKSWSWKFGDNTTSADQSPLHTYTQSGPVKPILQVFTAAGCPSKPDTNDLVINPSPVTDFTLPLGICVPGSTTFVNTTTISDGTLGTVTYLWDFDDAGSTSTDVDGVHIYTGAKPGGYNVKLTATSINGCFDDTVKNVIDVFEPPVAIFTIDRTALCEKQSVIFTNASTAAGNQRVNQWEWVFGDNSPNGTDSIVSHPYDAFASYDATLTVTTDKGCVSTISAPQTITVNQNPIVSYPGHPGICLEAVARPLTPATDASETTGLPGSFTYSGAGVESDGGGGYQFNPATSGGSNLNGYPVQALYITGDGCRDSATSPMKVFPTPVANWQTGSPACEQNGVGFTDASDAGYGKIITWKWDMLGDGNLDIRGNGASFSYTYPQADTFNVSLQVLTDSGCTSAITTIPLAVNYLPRVDVAIPGALCLPDATGTFKDMSTIPDGTENQFKYKWDFGDGSSSLQKDPSHTYHAAGASPYKIQLTVTSGNGCVDSLPQRIALTNMYPPPVAEFEAAPSEVCQGESMQFTDKSNGVTSPVTKWFWRFGDGGIDSVASLSHTFGRANYFDVKLTVTNGEGCSASSTRRVKVNAYPRIEMPDNVYIKPGTSTVLRPQVSAINSTNVSYSWTPGLYLDRTDIKNPVSGPPADQVYVLTVVAGTGCSSTDSIKVNLLMDLKPPNAFSPNGDGINDTWRIPNLEFYAGCEVEVFDRYGKIAYKTTGYSKAWDGTTGGKQLPTGVYYYIINPKNGYERFTGSVTILR